jgi:hypothetical protein
MPLPLVHRCCAAWPSALGFLLNCRVTGCQGVTSLSLASGSIDLNFTAKEALKNRDPVVFIEKEGGKFAR